MHPPKSIIVVFGLITTALSAYEFNHKLHKAVNLTNFGNDAGEKLNLQSQIIGGVVAKEDEFPFLLYLRPCENSRMCFICGGTIIAKDWVLTAAHCVTPISKYEYVHIYFGKHENWDGGDHDVKISKKDIYVHKEYKTTRMGVPLNDVALLKVPNAAHGIKKFPTLSSAEPSPPTVITVAGWGVVNIHTDSIAKTLKKVDIPVLSDTQCLRWLGSSHFVASTTWCAGTAKGGKDSCQGDSGGPAFVKSGNDFTVYGIVSYGAGCGRAMSPGVYASVASYKSWIEGVMAGTVKAMRWEGGSVSSKKCTFMEHLFGVCSSAGLNVSWTVGIGMLLFGYLQRNF